MSKPLLFGKYPGVVTKAGAEGRVKVKVPLLFGEQELPAWALPCWPPGPGEYKAPPVTAGVWVEFMAGDPDYPIWTGLTEVVT